MNRQIEKLVNGNIAVMIPIRLKYDGHKTVIIQPEKVVEELDIETMSPLQKALVQGFQYRDALESGKAASVSELARRENQERAFLFRALSLVNLAPDILEAILDSTAPDILEAILDSTEPPTLTLSRLRKGFPDDWDEQRKFFGIA